MEIRKTRPEEIHKVMAIYAHARQFMADHGNATQWGTTKPEQETIEEDIRQGNSYVCVEGTRLAATFYYYHGADPVYDHIYDGDWLDQAPYGVVHRIASAGNVKGAGSYCLQWAFSQCGNLKIDTHHDNIVMQNALRKNGFTYCGIIYLEDGQPRMAYQKRK